jgi:hypothetical protein
MRIVRYDPDFRRIWVCNARIHHGAIGAILIAGGLLGIALVIDDWHDRWWVHD